MSIIKDTHKKNLSIISLFDKLIVVANLTLVLIIFCVLVSATLMLFQDVTLMFSNSFNQGIGTVLGSILVVWVLLELSESQIDHIKGHKIDISIFVIIAIVAFIRKLLVASIKESSPDQTIMFLSSILVLTAVYWIIRHANSKYKN